MIHWTSSKSKTSIHLKIPLRKCETKKKEATVLEKIFTVCIYDKCLNPEYVYKEFL